MTRAPALNEVDVAGVSELITERDDVVFIDARESEDYAIGHIPGAVSAPAGTLVHATDSDSVARNDSLLLARESPVIVYCEDGRRSRVAAEYLLKRGFSQVYWLTEGLNGWRSNDLPLLPTRTRIPRR